MLKNFKMAGEEKIKKLLEENFKFDPCYLPALVKLSGELKGTKDQKLDEILEDTLSEFNLSKEDLDKFIDQHRSDLIEEAKRINL